MNSYQDEFEDFRKEAASEYFKMQMREEKARSRFYTAAFLLMIFLPLLIVAVRNYKRFDAYEKNQLRLQEDQKEIMTFANELITDSKFLKSLTFKDGIAKVSLVKFYDGTYDRQLENVYFDEDYMHQCLGHFLITKENNLYHVYTTDYCKMED